MQAQLIRSRHTMDVDAPPSPPLSARSSSRRREDHSCSTGGSSSDSSLASANVTTTTATAPATTTSESAYMLQAGGNANARVRFNSWYDVVSWTGACDKRGRPIGMYYDCFYV